MNKSTQNLLKSLLNDPSLIKTTSQAKQLHAQIVKLKGSGYSIGLSTSYVTMIISIYSNFGLVQDCLLLFNSLPSPPTKAWKSIIKCYASNGLSEECLSFFNKMRALGKSPDRNVFPSVLKACTYLRDLRLGEAAHGCVIRHGFDSDLYTGNALMNMYAKLQSLDSVSVFDGMSERNGAYVFGKGFNKLYDTCGIGEGSPKGNVGLDQKAGFLDKNVIKGFPTGSREMGSFDDCKTHLSSSACSSLSSQDYEEFQIFVPSDIARHELVPDVGWEERRNKRSIKIDSVRKVFETMPSRDLVSWNTVVGGFVEKGMYKEALTMVREMCSSNLKPDSFTLSTILPIFAEHVDISRGKEIHGYVIRHGLKGDLFIGSSLIDMYANCTRVDDSYRVFRMLPKYDSVSWNAIIAGCVQNGSFDDGLRLFREMLMANMKPMHLSFSSVMPACAHLTTLHFGKQLHGYIIRAGFDDNMYVASSLVDMYAKCGNIRNARWIFDKMETKDGISWTAMIMGYALHGHARDAILFFKEMEMNGVKPNAVSFVAVLTACSHAGLVDEAFEYYNSMTQKYGIVPGLEHYAAVSDLLARAGRLDDAYEFISNMHIQPTGSIWSTLLSACRVHKNVELAEKVAKEIFGVEPKYTSTYVLLSNVYLASGRWKDAARLRMKFKRNGMAKTPACSWIEVDNKLHSFVAGDESHPDYERINDALVDLLEWIEQEAYFPDVNKVLDGTKEEEKMISIMWS